MAIQEKKTFILAPILSFLGGNGSGMIYFLGDPPRKCALTEPSRSEDQRYSGDSEAPWLASSSRECAVENMMEYMLR